MNNAPGLTLTLQESQDILLPYGALHVTDDCPGRVVQELNTDLSDTTTRPSPSEDLYTTGMRSVPMVQIIDEIQRVYNLDDTGELDGCF